MSTSLGFLRVVSYLKRDPTCRRSGSSRRSRGKRKRPCKVLFKVDSNVLPLSLPPSTTLRLPSLYFFFNSSPKLVTRLSLSLSPKHASSFFFYQSLSFFVPFSYPLNCLFLGPFLPVAPARKYSERRKYSARSGATNLHFFVIFTHFFYSRKLYEFERLWKRFDDFFFFLTARCRRSKFFFFTTIPRNLLFSTVSFVFFFRYFVEL